MLPGAFLALFRLSSNVRIKTKWDFLKEYLLLHTLSLFNCDYNITFISYIKILDFFYIKKANFSSSFRKNKDLSLEYYSIKN